METNIENNFVPADANVYRLKCIILLLFFVCFCLDYDGEEEAMEENVRSKPLCGTATERKMASGHGYI